MNAVFAKPLVRALVAAVITSGLGIAINVATDLKGNLSSWLVVAALTLISGFSAATPTGRGENPTRTLGRETILAVTDPGSNHKTWWGRRRTTEVHGIVMRKEIETHSDGTRIERTDYFSVELALRDMMSRSPLSREESNDT